MSRIKPRLWARTKPEMFDVDQLSDGYIHYQHGIPDEHVNAFRVGARYANHANGNLIHWYEQRIEELEQELRDCSAM